MAPKRRKTGAMNRFLCGCFKVTDEPPEIQLNTTTDHINAPLVAEAILPMPPPDELQAKFAELVEELDLPTERKKAMFELTPKKQWQIYCSNKLEQDDANKLATSWPDYYIDKINALSTIMKMSNHDEEEVAARLELVDGLKTALRTQPMRFVLRFTELDGLACILNFLQNMAFDVRESRVHTSIIGCVKALMNSTQGRADVLAHPDAINVIAQSLACDSLRTKNAVLEILGALCLVPGGHKGVLEAMMHFQSYAYERTRFQKIINELSMNHHSPEDDGFEVNLKTTIMSFLNALLNCGAGEDHLEFRCHLRYELILLGIQPIMEQLRLYENELLNKHISFFEMVRREDEEELAGRYDVNHVDTKSANEMFEFIQKKLCYTEAYPHFLSLLHHSMLLPLNRGGSPLHWQLFDRIVQQITIQQADGNDPDVSYLKDFSVGQKLKSLIGGEESDHWRETYEAIKKQHDEMKIQLERKERECAAKIEEKEELMKTLTLLKGKLEIETKKGVTEIDHKTFGDDAEDPYSIPADENSYDVVFDGSGSTQQNINLPPISDDAKENAPPVPGVPPGVPPPPGVPSPLGAPPPSPGVAPPPGVPSPPGVAPSPGVPHPPGAPPPGAPPPPGVPPPPGAPPPPPGAPPPPGSVTPGPPKVSLPPKNIPTSSTTLKSFNWSKLPESKISGTIWTELDDAKAYKLINLSDFDKTFSAQQSKQQSAGVPASKKSGPNEDESNKKIKEISLIEGRRAQNCTILLSKLKLSNEEIKKSILSCDKSEHLQKDMLEQLLKYIPTSEEVELFNEFKSEDGKMAKADKFLFEMSQIHHYEQRLLAVFFKKKFSERTSEIEPKVEAIAKASKEINESKKLRKVLEMILAFGNYMNKGQRGNAYGFKLQSLSKLIDTKSTTNRNITLMHFLLEMLEKNSPDIVKLPNDLSHVDVAARISLGELEKEVASLRMGLKNLTNELEVQKARKSAGQSASGDQFVSVMNEFLAVANVRFAELENLLMQAKTMFAKVAETFGEDPVKVQPDAFFGLFTSFLSNFKRAINDNIAMKKKKIEEEKKINNQKHPNDPRKMSGLTNLGGGSRGEFDDLVSALKTGKIFEKDGGKFQKRKMRM